MKTPRVRCPTCQREVLFTPESKFRPFCSERCRMVDLGAWLAGERSIAGDSATDADAPAAPDEPAE